VKGSIAPPAAQSALSPLKLFRWARAAIRGITAPFYLVVLLALVTNVMTQYNAQLIANFIGQAQREATTEEAVPALEKADASANGPVGFLDYVLPSDTRWTAVLFAVTAILVIALSFANRVGTVWINTLMLQKLQLRLHDKLIRLGPSYHARHDMGENSAVIMQYTAGAQPMLRDVLSFPFVRGVSLATAIIFLFYNLSELRSQDDVLYALLAVLLIVLPVGGWWLSSRLRGAYGEVRERLAAVNNTLVDSLTAPQELQLMNAAPRRTGAFAAKLKDLAAAQLRAVIQGEKANQFQAAVPTILQVGLILWAVFVVGGDAVQAVVGIYLFVPRVVQPIQDMIQFYGSLNTAWPNIEKIGSILEQPFEIEDKGRKTARDLKGHDLALHDLTYRPTPERTVLDRISIAFPPDKVTALVGRSGSGKTTIFRLASRLFDPQEGRITVSGVDIRDIKLDELRSIIATVSQFPLFVEADIRENLRLAVPSATDAAMEAVCCAADLWAALERISPTDPLGTPVPRMAGKSGLAGGERRRLAIARALLSEPRILLLDEPSTGIDAVSVAKIVDTIRSAKVGRTVLLVDHDVDLVAALSDQICCLEDGRFTDIGSPAELAGRPSLFLKLSQAKKAYADTTEFEVHGSVPVRPAEVADHSKSVAGSPKQGMAMPPPGQQRAAGQAKSAGVAKGA
jgi:ABC-type multidrug transport system fused ATPase/permease subunit